MVWFWKKIIKVYKINNNKFKKNKVKRINVLLDKRWWILIFEGHWSGKNSVMCIFSGRQRAIQLNYAMITF